MIFCWIAAVLQLPSWWFSVGYLLFYSCPADDFLLDCCRFTASQLMIFCWIAADLQLPSWWFLLDSCCLTSAQRSFTNRIHRCCLIALFSICFKSMTHFLMKRRSRSMILIFKAAEKLFLWYWKFQCTLLFCVLTRGLYRHDPCLGTAQCTILVFEQTWPMSTV